jgi:LacI family transcriptional regulator
VGRLLSGASPATALIAGNNRITIMVLRALSTLATRPALVGFDDFELADLLDPPVTVLAHDIAAMGRAAAELLFARMEGDTSPPRRLVLPANIIPRGSGEVSP